MEGYMIIYVKKDKVGHVRYEIGDGRGYKEIRGLSVKWNPSWTSLDMETVYEKGEEDSHGNSVYDTDIYSASDKIPLDREELLGAMSYTRENDDEELEYGVVSKNCNDFASGALSAAGKDGCVGDYLTNEQKEDLQLSQTSDLIKCRIPKQVERGVKKVAKFVNKIAKQSLCNGTVRVSGYQRLGHSVSGYTRSCGRH